MSPRAAYLARHVPTSPTSAGCLEWTGPRHEQGYGRVWDADRRRVVYAHRLAYELAHGVDLARGQVVRHACDNPCCVNVAHLELGTQGDNMRDKATRGRARALHGEANPLARLTEADVREVRARLAAGDSQRAVAAAFGISQPRVAAIAAGRAWSHVK